MRVNCVVERFVFLWSSSRTARDDAARAARGTIGDARSSALERERCALVSDSPRWTKDLRARVTPVTVPCRQRHRWTMWFPLLCDGAAHACPRQSLTAKQTDHWNRRHWTVAGPIYYVLARARIFEAFPLGIGEERRIRAGERGLKSLDPAK